MDRNLNDKNTNKQKAGKLFYVLFAVIALVVAAGLYSVVINSHIREKSEDKIIFDLKENGEALSEEALKEIEKLNPDCIIVLGCAIEDYETPTDMLRDRLDAGIALYNMGVAPKILLTGDNGQIEYNEIHTMLTYTLQAGVPPQDVFCDHAGFSTSESMIRAAEIFSVKSAVVVTQRYHEYRALYNAEKMGIEVLGVSASQEHYLGQPLREIRELLARNKDFLLFNFGNPEAVGGEKIDISGDGRVSHGE